MQRYNKFQKDVRFLARGKQSFFILVFLLCMALSTSAVAQNMVIKFSEKQTSVERILNNIEKQTGFRVGRDGSFDVTRRITLEKDSYSLSDLLELAVQNSGHYYIVGERGITIQRGSVNQTGSSVAITPIDAEQSIFGYVQSLDKGTGFIRAKVTLQGKTNHETITDSLGRYVFDNVPVGVYKVTASYAKYHPQEITQVVKKSENVRVMFLLNPIYDEDHRTWAASFAYPEYETQPKLNASELSNHIAPYQRQTLPSMAIKTNLLYDAALITNLGIELRLSNRFTLDLPVIYKPFAVKKGGIQEFRLLTIQPELRYWQEPFNGHFWGVHLNYTQYNIGGRKLPFGIFPGVENARYSGDLYGIGLSYGYHAILTSRLGLEFTFGFGYGYAAYERFTCADCSTYIDKGNKHYFGPTKAGISLVYILK